MSSPAPPAPRVPGLPSGLVAVVKRACPTCELVAPVLRELAARLPLTVYTQDDLAFPDGLAPRDDTGLAVSYHHRIGRGPALLRVDDGVEVERAIGWHRGDWERLAGVSGLGAGLPEWRPGCGSRSVDPDVAPELAVRFEAHK